MIEEKPQPDAVAGEGGGNDDDVRRVTEESWRYH